MALDRIPSIPDQHLAVSEVPFPVQRMSLLRYENGKLLLEFFPSETDASGNTNYRDGLKNGPKVATGKLKQKWRATAGTKFTKLGDHFLAHSCTEFAYTEIG